MFFKYVRILFIFIFVYLLYSCDYLKEMKSDFINQGFNVIDVIYLTINGKSNTLSIKENAKEKIFSKNELKRYTTLEDGLYISILGQVFDVTKGSKHYGPGETYHAFTGCDASRAFITGQFDDEGLTDDISSLSNHQVKLLNDWVKFYHENYIYKGKLNGRYYNEYGNPTEQYHNVQQKLMHAKEESLKDEQRKLMFPPCNVKWEVDSGTVIWCSKRSGGIERDWIGVPRMLFESPNSKEYRCTCVKLDSKEYEETKGMLKEYDGCPRTSSECAIKINS